MTAYIICGSESDSWFAKQIIQSLSAYNIESEVHYISAHKSPHQVLYLLGEFANTKKYVIITVAGRSNALSGVVAANTTVPVIACPPFKDNIDMLVNIQSTLQMPSKVPVLTILDPGNCAYSVKRIFDMIDRK
jgi:5-(carboxyamino)imidazole ribonucleotide mutase